MMETTGILAKALYTNTPEAKNELFFRKGDILNVLKFDYEGQSGWWFCSLRGEKGLCPGNYLEILKEDDFAPIYANDVPTKVQDDPQETYDFPKSHPDVVVSKPDSPELFYDIPPSEKSFDSQSNASTRLCGGSSNVSIMSSGTLSHYSSSSSNSARSLEIGADNGGSQNSVAENGGGKSISTTLRARQDFALKSSSASVRSSGISSEAEADCWYDVPRAPSTINGDSKSQSSLLLDDSIDLYDVPRSMDDEKPANWKDTPGLFTKVQLRNKINSASAAQNRRGQFVSQGPGQSLIIGSSTSSSTSRSGQLSTARGQLNKSVEICDGVTSLTFDDSDSMYDKPPTRGHSRKAPSSVCSSSDTISISSAGNTDFRRVKHRERGSSIVGGAMGAAASQESLGGGGADIKTLPLTPKAAISVCEKMRQEVLTGINSVLMFVKPKWRSKVNLEDVMPDLRFGCIRLSLAIKDFAEFSSRSVSNARKLGNDLLIAKLRRLLIPINSSSQMIQQSVDELEAYFWSPDRLSMSESEENSVSDALNHLTLCARNLTHHVTEIVNFIALHSTALFKEEQNFVELSPAPTPVPVEPEPEPEPELDDSDYDYVVLNSSKNNKTRPAPSPPRPETVIATSPTPALNSKDIQLLEFYSDHISTIGPLLSHSISTFISSIQQNEPPKVFNGHLKYVILLAYKFLFAGDTVHRNIVNAEVKAEVEAKANDLHTSVVELHDMSKIATKHFPMILPMEKIIEHVWQTTAAALQLKKVIFNATCI